MNRKLTLPSARKCPYDDCRSQSDDPLSGRVVRNGRFRRAEDAKWIPRFKCVICRRTFSTATFSACYKQKRRRLNPLVFNLLSSGVSLRRIARRFGANYKTVDRKLLFLAKQAQMNRLQYLAQVRQSGKLIENIQFDEMETFEISKCLPLSIPLVVEVGTRRILGFRVAQMPAKGPLAEISVRKYGFRADHRPQAADALFREVREAISPQAQIMSDQNPKYPGWLKLHFKDATHTTCKGRRGCIVGQGELKKIGFDPLFDLNHTCAMFRANVNRLFRRTWNTTKRRDRLMAHLEIYAYFHNSVLI